MRQWLDYRVIAIGFGSLLVAGVGRASLTPRATTQEDPTITVVERRDLESKVTTAGSLVSNRRTLFTAPYNGYIKKIYVTLGQKVKEGDPVVTVTQTLRAGADEAYPLRAPFTGFVTQVLKAEGEWVEMGATSAIVRMDDTTRLFLISDVPESDVLKIKVGARAKVKVNAVMTRSYQAIVREVALAAKDRKDGWSRNGDRVEFEVRMEIVDRDDALRPGLSALVDIITEQRKLALSIPHEFLQKEGEKYIVNLPGGGKREVKIGLKSDVWVEILEGLQEQDRVKMVDFYSIKEGA